MLHKNLKPFPKDFFWGESTSAYQMEGASLEDAVVQNLKDAGCDEAVVDEFMKLSKNGEKQKQFKLLETHRKSLLDKIHSGEKQIDCLDYLVFQMKKETEDQ